MKLTRPTVDRAWRERSVERRTIVRDELRPGLLLIINAQSASWAYEYKPRGRDDQGRRYGTRQMKLGDLSAVDLDDARALRDQAKAAVARGEDPARTARIEIARKVEERCREETIANLVEEYCLWLDRQDCSTKHKVDEKRQTKQALELAGVGELPAVELRRSHVMKILDVVNGPALPRKLLGSLSRFCSWLIDREVIAVNPVLLLDRRRRPMPPAPRSRVLSLKEVGSVWNAAFATVPARGKATDKAAWSRLVQFTLLMPARIGEIGSMRWADVDLDRGIWTQPGQITKNGDSHKLPLPPAAAALLREHRAGTASSKPIDPVWLGPSQGRPFNAWAGLLRHVRNESGIANWSWHDIRRTVVSHLAEHGVAESVADGLLNHRQSATRSGVLGVYQRSNRHSERAEALALWARLVERAAAGKLTDNVVAFDAAAAV